MRALGKVGFVPVRQKGSHVQLRRVETDGKVTTFPVPVHAGRIMKRGTLKGVLRLASMETVDLIELL